MGSTKHAVSRVFKGVDLSQTTLRMLWDVVRNVALPTLLIRHNCTWYRGFCAIQGLAVQSSLNDR